MVTLPAFHPRQQVAAVLHRAGFEQLFSQRITRTSVSRLVQRVRYFVFQSDHLARQCEPWVSDERRRVIPNTVDPDLVPEPAELEAKRRLRRGSSEPWHLLYLSHMMPEKGYLDALDAFARLRGEGLDARMTFAGSWPDASSRADFLARARTLGVADRIAMPGPRLDRQEVGELHLSADVLILPTYHPTETQPVAVLEALAAGTPVIVTEREAFTDMLGNHPEAGALVPPRDAEAVANAARRLLDLPVWSSASEAAEARFAGRFSPARVGELWNDLVAELQYGPPR